MGKFFFKRAFYLFYTALNIMNLLWVRENVKRENEWMYIDFYTQTFR